jgi:uncharacterized protein YndB with AHSA1/START domain
MIQITTQITAPLEKVWDAYNMPEHITNWNAASPDWHCPASVNDLRVGGKFKNHMAAKDGSFEFDFEGTYNAIIPHQYIAYTLDDQRKVAINFKPMENNTIIDISFEPEGSNPIEMQQAGWQAILNNFKTYVEKLG